jgi:hypothetical protein
LALQPKEIGPVARWFDQLANWQFVAALAGLLILVNVLIACLLLLAFGHIYTGFFTNAVIWTAGFTAVQAWMRWK